MTSPVLQLQGLVAGYPDRPLTSPLSLDLPAGSRLGVIGGNGSGKSTLMRTLLGLIPPLAGRAAWKEGVTLGYVPQENQVDLLFPLSVFDLLKMGMVGRLPRFRRSSQTLNRDLRQILEEMEIEPLQDALLRDLSGGEKQRALIGRAWASRPQVLLMDEPFNSLDYRFKEKLWGIFREWQGRQALTLILIDHDLNRLINQVDRLIVLGPAGALCGAAEEILQEETLSRAYGVPLHVHRENDLLQVHFL
ncbi:MAG: metal ABC transporter ATP-binding protein [Deltaproteobacteria bacterium]|nr:metal ABC transporter ATP-binding protein [Deltaproteobacteria bacterium]